jgi:hypothetical protein
MQIYDPNAQSSAGLKGSVFMIMTLHTGPSQFKWLIEMQRE